MATALEGPSTKLNFSPHDEDSVRVAPARRGTWIAIERTLTGRRESLGQWPPLWPSEDRSPPEQLPRGLTHDEVARQRVRPFMYMSSQKGKIYA